MKNIYSILIVLFSSIIGVGFYKKNKAGKTTLVEEKVEQTVQQTKAKSIHTLKAKTLLDGEEKSFKDYEGDVLLVVNTASKCGLTPQYEELQNLHEKYSKKGLKVIGFPSDNFANQEFEKESEIIEFCEKNYGVTFELFEKVDVKGDFKHPVYQFLTEKKRNGVLDSNVSWNFQKYLLDKNGKLIAVFNPRVKVTDEKVLSQIEKLIK